MKIVIGGISQGKSAYVLQQEQADPEDVFDGAQTAIDRIGQYRILDRVHLLIRRLMWEEAEPVQQGQTACSWQEAQERASDFLQRYVDTHPDCVLICDEIGSGIVPMDPREREWREAVGRILCRLTAQAQEVERVLCGIAIRLK